MSRLRQLAHEQLETGAAQRRNWSPNSTSAHYKVYSWWTTKTRRRPVRENFCHYWRVVLFWAPLRWLVKPLLGALALAVLAAIVFAAVVWTGEVLGLLLGVALFAYGVLGLSVARAVLYELNKEEFAPFEWQWFSDRSTTIKSLLAVLTLPVLLVFGAGVIVLASLAVFFVSLHDEFDLYHKVGHWFVGARLGDSKYVSWIRPWLVVPVALAVCGIWFTWAWFVLAWAGGVLFAIGLVVLGSFLVDVSRQRRADHAEQARNQRAIAHTDMVLKNLFGRLHPKWANNVERYRQWRVRYHQHCLEYMGRSEYEISDWWHIRFVEESYTDLLTQDPQPSSASSSAAATRPGRFRRSLTAVADFLQLIWSAVLAKKWGICPWVEIPS